MTVCTWGVIGRRSPKYKALDDVLKDAEYLAGTDVEMLGNWSLGQVFRHLALAVNGSMDGFTFRVTRIETLFVRIFMKWWILRCGIPAGYGFLGRGKSVMPGATPAAEGLAELRAALARFAKEAKHSPHPFFGKLTPEEWYQFHLRHAELHMSFAVPLEGSRLPRRTD